MHCLGCGGLTDATNRRSLASVEGRCVAKVWREFIVTEDLEVDVASYPGSRTAAWVAIREPCTHCMRMRELTI